MRTFIALELSDPVRQALADVQKTLRPAMPRAKWTRPEGTHLTLKFLGETTSDQVNAISAALDGISSRFPQLTLILNGIGAFPRLGSPNVLWVGIKECAELRALQKAVEAAIAPLGFPTEKRPFRAHLTLARLTGESWPPELRQQFLETDRLVQDISWDITRIVLFRSELKPTGAVYTAIHTSLLSKRITKGENDDPRAW